MTTPSMHFSGARADSIGQSNVVRPSRPRGSRRGQSSVEYLLLVAILLVLVMPVGFWALSRASDESALAQADAAARTIANAADQAAAAGEGARVQAVVDLPDQLESGMVSGREVNLRLRTAAGSKDAFALSRANLTGDIPDSPGRCQLAFELLPSGVVNVSRVY